MMDSSSESKEFEREVAELLTLAGYSVTMEKLLGHKKVDLYATERRLGSERRFAVECKSSSSVLTQLELSTLYGSYLPLVRANLIDEILVVTKCGLAPSAQTMLEESRELSHRTFTELQSDLIDFKQYLQYLQQQYAEDGLISYYVPIRDTNDVDLESYIDSWLLQAESQPLAILATYGMGKTTFARHLSFILSQKALESKQQRIPIFIKLAEISSEQSLEGLLGKLFTSTSTVRNYNFDTFMALNRAGRFVVMLDGFDEMKHTLSWDEFRYNFRQINRLVCGNSRVILLGRPTAFLSDEEHLHALHGIRRVGTRDIREPDWPDYQEIQLSPFNSNQIEQFFREYIGYKLTLLDNSKPPTTSQNSYKRWERSRQRLLRFMTRGNQLGSKQLEDLAQRPVQLRMIVEVLPEWEGPIDQMTTALLYSLFIDLMIEREQDKITRRLFGTADRREFLRDIALWLWTNKREMSLSAQEIPNTMLQKHSRSKNEDLEPIRRDLVSACFLARKMGESLYFPHRSFQEFLVAEEILIQLSRGEMKVNDADDLLTHEVSEFLGGLINEKTFNIWDRRLGTYFGVLSRRFALAFTAQPESARELSIRSARSTIPWYPLFLAVGIAAGKVNNLSSNAFINELLTVQHSNYDPRYILLCHLCIVGLSGYQTGANTKLISSTVISSVAHICELTLRNMRECGQKNPDPIVCQFISKMVIPLEKTGAIRIDKAIDLSHTYSYLCKLLKDYCLIDSWIVGDSLRTDDIILPQKITPVKNHLLSEILSFQMKYCWK